MIKEILHRNETILPNSREITALREYFPACFKEEDGSFDIERFKEYLIEKLTVSQDGYELKFLGKNYARMIASLDTTTVIVPDEEHNSKPENVNSENIYISGDNLDGLKHLLKSYSRRVKCIYIDPPYNTDSDDFVYKDSFNFSVEELSEKLSISEEKAQRILDLTKRGSASHSAWLMFMCPRLILARDLLTPDGIIFISIDDNEQGNLKLLCDDVFGEENFVGQTVRVSSPTQNVAKYLSIMHDYTLVYCKNKSKNDGNWKVKKNNADEFENRARRLFTLGLSINEIETELRALVKYPRFYDFDHFTQCDAKGVFQLVSMGGVETGNTQTILLHPLTKKPCAIPQGGWRHKDDTLQELITNDRIYFGNNENYIPRQKFYLQDYLFQIPKGINFFDTQSDIRFLEEHKLPFDFPKPKEYIKYLITMIACQDGDIILDFFSGSGTTAHAVIQLNTENVNKYKFIMVQWAENVKPASKPEQQGYKTIDQIGIERIKRATKAIHEASPLTTDDLDLGFKHYTLVEPSQNTLDKLEAFDPNDNTIFASDLLTEFGKPTVLTTWLCRDGYGLTVKPEEIDFAGYKGYYIGKHLYLIDEELSSEAIDEILTKLETDGNFNPHNIVLFGYSFLWTEREALQTNLKRLKETEKNLPVHFDIRY